MSVVQAANPRDIQVRNVSIKVWVVVHHITIVVLALVLVDGV
jgi:hypothetical protein